MVQLKLRQPPKHHLGQRVAIRGHYALFASRVSSEPPECFEGINAETTDGELARQADYPGGVESLSEAPTIYCVVRGSETHRRQAAR